MDPRAIQLETVLVIDDDVLDRLVGIWRTNLANNGIPIPTFKEWTSDEASDIGCGKKWLPMYSKFASTHKRDTKQFLKEVFWPRCAEML